jgi:hypothetical protein
MLFGELDGYISHFSSREHAAIPIAFGRAKGRSAGRNRGRDPAPRQRSLVERARPEMDSQLIQRPVHCSMFGKRSVKSASREA